MNGLKKSDEARTTCEGANKGARARGVAAGKGFNQVRQSTRRRVSGKLAAAARIRRQRETKERLTALFHHITRDALGAYFALKKDAAAGRRRYVGHVRRGSDERLLGLQGSCTEVSVPPAGSAGRDTQAGRADTTARDRGAARTRSSRRRLRDVIGHRSTRSCFLASATGSTPASRHTMRRCPASGSRRKVSWIVHPDHPARLRHDPAGLVDHVPSHRFGDRRVIRRSGNGSNAWRHREWVMGRYGSMRHPQVRESPPS